MEDWRPDLYVVARFLEKLYPNDQDYSHRKLQMAVRLNYDLYRKYLAFLEGRGLVTAPPPGTEEARVRVTPKGQETYRRFLGWARDLMGTA